MQRIFGLPFIVLLGLGLFTTGLLVRPACCLLQSPIVSAAPSEAYIGKEVLVEATISVLSG